MRRSSIRSKPRLYVELVKSNENSKTKVFIPTEQGILTDAKLTGIFLVSIINVSYTANMEKDLDEIAEGKQESVTELREFYDKFVPLLDEAYEKMEKVALKRQGSCVRNVAVSLFIAMENMDVLFPAAISLPANIPK